MYHGQLQILLVLGLEETKVEKRRPYSEVSPCKKTQDRGQHKPWKTPDSSTSLPNPAEVQRPSVQREREAESSPLRGGCWHSGTCLSLGFSTKEPMDPYKPPEGTWKERRLCPANAEANKVPGQDLEAPFPYNEGSKACPRGVCSAFL